MNTAPIRLHRPGELSLAALPPLALYVHLPWCLRKCPYCDFNSHELSAPGLPSVADVQSADLTPLAAHSRARRHSPGAGSPPRGGEPRTGTPGSGSGRDIAARLDTTVESRYLDALCADLEASLPLVWGRRIVSVFIGGGTPSLFSPDGIARLLGDVRARLPLVPGCEITLEANPGTFERDRFRAFADAGITRLSIGVQSFDDRALAAIGRVHDGAQARAAVEEAARAFATWNIDLMYALPGQAPADLERDLDTALAYAPPHLSVYHLTIEPNTVFASRPPPALPDDDTASAMLDAITARAAAAGLERYEVSAYARPGHRCAHNVNYWTYGDYLGIGAGAHGKLSFPHRIVRQVRWREPAAYIEHALAGRAVSNEHEVAAAELPFEFMLNALRLRAGFERRLYAERTGLPRTTIDAAVAQAVARGWLDDDGTRISPTARGYDFLSDVQQLFL